MYALASQLRPEMGFWLLLPMFAAVIMGGVGNPIGALVGAIIIGVAQQVSASFLNPAYGPAVAFVLMVVVLVLRPQGLFGQAGEEGNGPAGTAQGRLYRPPARPARLAGLAMAPGLAG